MTMNRIVFLVDGFNLYHSVVEASRHLGGATTKWLDISSLCSLYLPYISRDAKLEQIYYFSAFADHLRAIDPGKVQRHEDFIKCLRTTGIVDALARFKARDAQCPRCRWQWKKHEEKETDVGIAVKLFEVFSLDTCDTVVLVTGDTDLAPSVRTAKFWFPHKAVVCIFPYRRKNKELAQLAHKSFNIKPATYCKCQFPDPFPLPDGTSVCKPLSW